MTELQQMAAGYMVNTTIIENYKLRNKLRSNHSTTFTWHDISFSDPVPPFQMHILFLLSFIFHSIALIIDTMSFWHLFLVLPLFGKALILPTLSYSLFFLSPGFLKFTFFFSLVQMLTHFWSITMLMLCSTLN